MVLTHVGSIWSTPVNAYSGFSFTKVFASGATTAAAGTSFSIVLKKDGYVWGVGNNLQGQLGDGTRNNRRSFLAIKKITGAKAVAAGDCHSIVLGLEGCLW